MKTKISALLVACLVSGGLLILAVWKGIPLLLRGAVSLVPVSWEEKLGETVTGTLAREGATCENEELLASIEEIQERLEPALAPNPYRFQIKVVNVPEVNALAAPGGHLVLFYGLVERMDTPEQLAGVVAHEMQHVVQRHSMNAMARALGMQLFFALVLGDAGGLTGLAGGLGLLHFMRSDEKSADLAGIETLMRAGIAPRSMVEGFAKLKAANNSAEPSWKYLSTHPPTEERIAYLEDRSRQWKGTPRPFRRPLAKFCAAAR
jgi:predicted Zn-dependent protease